MNEVDIPAGETAEIITLSRFESVDMKATGDDINIGQHETSARSGQTIQEGNREAKFATKPETLYAYSENGGTIEFRKQGFISLFQNYNELDINLSTVGVTNVPISIDAVGVTSIPTSIDAQNISNITTDINAQSVGNIEIDIADQTLSTVSQNQTRQASEAVVEVNADQTVNVFTTDTVTTTVTASSGEVWELRAFYFQLDIGSQWDGSSTDDINVTVESEAQGVEYGYGRANDVLTGPIDYNSDGWSSEVDTQRDNIISNHRIDDTNGLKIAVQNESPDHEIQNDRTIRLVFRVITT